jgi:hypothetical protein
MVIFLTLIKNLKIKSQNFNSKFKNLSPFQGDLFYGNLLTNFLNTII